MKICEKCGYKNYKPKDICPQCKASYKDMSAQCTPDLGGYVEHSTHTEGKSVGFIKSPFHTGGR